MSARSATLGRHSESGPEQDHHRRSVRGFQLSTQVGGQLCHRTCAPSVCTISGRAPATVARHRQSRHRGHRRFGLCSSASRRRESKLRAEVEPNDRARWPRTRAAPESDARCNTPRHAVGARRARDVVDVEAGDRGGNDPPLAVDDRMMNQREEEIGHVTALRRASRSGRRRAVRLRACVSRHARIFPWSPLSRISGTRIPAKLLGPSVLRILEQSRARTIPPPATRISQHARNQPRDRLDHHHRRHLAAAQHVVADRHLLIDHRAHALVDAFVAPARSAPGRARAWPGRAPSS